jgi:PIN domain nuclease of toxin-antitoxin system
MRLLLDTHVILWGLEDSPRLGSRIRALIADPENTVCVSVVSVWEISIKSSLNKLQITTDLETYTHCR